MFLSMIAMFHHEEYFKWKNSNSVASKSVKNLHKLIVGQNYSNQKITIETSDSKLTI